MPTVTVREDQEQVPPGTYPARLLEVKAMEPSAAHPDWGSSYVWEFEVTSGANQGRRCSCFTKQEASTANNLGRLLVQLLGREVRKDENIELRDFIGREYSINVGWNKDKSKTRVQAVMIQAQPVHSPSAAPAPANGPPSAAPAATPAPAQQRKGPPPRKAEPPARLFWVEHPEPSEPRAMDEHALARYLEAEKLNPAHVKCALDGDGEYKTAADFGFKDTIPF